MSKAAKGNRVRVHYTGTLADGSVFDSSRERGEPLEFVLGQGQLIPGFERAVEGMAPGESAKVTIPSDEAYGPRNEQAVRRMERSKLPPKIPAREGERIMMRAPDGGMMPMTITSIEGDMVTLDGNHPLAGKDLTFDIELVEIV